LPSTSIASLKRFSSSATSSLPGPASGVEASEAPMRASCPSSRAFISLARHQRTSSRRNQMPKIAAMIQPRTAALSSGW